MKNLLRHILSPLLLGSALLALPAHADDLTPEQVADLYLKTLIGVDLESAQKINDYLREDQNGEDALNLETLKNIRSFSIDGMTEGFMDAGPGSDMPGLKPHALEFFAAMYDALHRAQCTVGKSTQTKSTATVHYTCTVPNLDPATKSELGALANDDSSEEAIKTFLTKGTAAYQNAPLTRTVEGEFSLQASPHGKWHSDAPFRALDPIADALRF